MTIADKAVQIACEMANDSRYGYDQASRWGPDFDCSSFIITVWEKAGVPVKTGGATYTGNMRGVFLRCGFRDVTGQVNLKTGRGLLPGDVLLNYAHHAAMSIGGGRIVQAGSNEKGTAAGGETGDQTGREITVRSYYDYPWNCVLRYGAGEKATEIPTASGADYIITLRQLQSGDQGADVKALQGELIAASYTCGPDGADGKYGYNTRNAVLRFQQDAGLEVDGIVGRETRRALTGAK